MGTINNILGMSPEVNKSGRSSEPKKVQTAKEGKAGGKKASQVSDSSVKADISQIGREFLTLKMEASRYLDEVKESSTLTQKEIEDIKDKIATNYYFEPEVIDQIVDKLLQMPNFGKLS